MRDEKNSKALLMTGMVDLEKIHKPLNFIDSIGLFRVSFTIYRITLPQRYLHLL